jgi:hypothetical protein
MSRDIRCPIVTAILLVTVASGCSANHRSAETSSTSATTVTTTPQSGRVPLYEQRESANPEGLNGTPINATLVGANYPTSTGMWIGCEGVAATTTYRLDRKFTQLTATVGLQPHAPDGLAAEVTISGDGQVLSQFIVRKTATTAIDLKVDRTDSLVVAALLQEGRCAPSDAPYGALGDAFLTTTLD